MQNHYTPYICSEQIDVIENLLPRRWAADDIPVRANRDLFRQLMLQGEIRRNISAISRISRKFRPTVGMRIENHNLFTKLISYIRDIRHSQTEPTSCSYCKSPHGHAVRSAQGGIFKTRESLPTAPRQSPRQGKRTIAATKSTRRRRLPRNYRGDVQTAPTASLTSRSARFAVPMPKRSATVSRSSSVMSPVLPFTERTCGFDQASKSLSSAEK